MAKTINTRMSQKHDTEENWVKAINFIPLAGEIIIYDQDTAHPYERIKIGNGASNVNDLPFLFDYQINQIKGPTIIAQSDTPDASQYAENTLWIDTSTMATIAAEDHAF